MTCQRCRKQTFVIFVTEEHERLCDVCHESDKQTPHKIDGEKVKSVIDEMYEKIRLDANFNRIFLKFI